MKKILPFIFIAAAYFAFKFTKKTIAAKNLNVKIRTLKLNPISAAAVIVDVINPTNYDISFDSILFDLTIDGNAISTISLQKTQTIKANKSTELNLPIKLNAFDILLFVKKFISDKGKISKIALNGSINGEGFVIPVLIEQNINI